jgi:hypothetical protein
LACFLARPRFFPKAFRPPALSRTQKDWSESQIPMDQSPSNVARQLAQQTCLVKLFLDSQNVKIRRNQEICGIESIKTEEVQKINPQFT